MLREERRSSRKTSLRTIEGLGLLLGGLIVSAGSLAHAQGKADQPPASKPAAAAPGAAQSPPASCPAACFAPRSTVAACAGGVAAALGDVPAGAVVIAAPLSSDVPARRGDVLVAKLAEQVAGRLGAGVRFEPTPHGHDEARELAKQSAALIYLEPTIERGRLRLVADAYPVSRTVWARARSPLPGPVSHALAHGPIDAEVRAYLAPLGIDEPTVARYQGADPDIQALACGDLDGDGVGDVVTMTRQRVLSVALRGGKVERLREARWEDLAAIAAVPMKQPLGFATIVEGPTALTAGGSGAGGYLDVAISDRDGSVRLDATLSKIGNLKGTAVGHGRATACTTLADLLLGERVQACAPGDPQPQLPLLGHRADAISSGYQVQADGSGSTLVALRSDSTLVLRDAAGDKVIARVGAQLAVADLDQDGEPELVSTLDVLSAKHDVLEVRTVRKSGIVERRLRLPVPTGVEALAVCPPDDGTASAPIVLATRGELWVVR